jgi:NADPH-dependent curcumin reductase CurA
MNIVKQRVRMQGFVILDYANRWAEGGKQLAQWFGEGKLKGRETIIKGGLTVAEEALLRLFDGDNIGMSTFWR